MKKILFHRYVVIRGVFCLIMVLSLIKVQAQSYTFSNVCPTTTVDLTAHAPLSTPAGTTVTYHTGTPATGSNKVPTPTAVAAGTYYMAFEDATNNCYSPTQLVTVTINGCGSYTFSNVCPATTVDLTAHAPLSTPSGTTVTYHTGTPATVSNKVPTPTAVAAGTYYMAFEDAANNCYSPTQLVTVTVNPTPNTPSVSSPQMNTCPATTVNLNTISAALTPSVSGGVFEWHTTYLFTSPLVSTPTGVGAGTYYLFEKSPSNCYSQSFSVQVQIQNCCPNPECIPITIIRSY